jgi:PAS fold
MLARQPSAPSTPFAPLERPFVADARRSRTDAVSMQLNALRQRGRIVDFVWEFASDAAAALLRCHPHTLRGRYLRDVAAAGPLGHPALIDRYRRVLEHGNARSFEQIHLVNGRQEIVIHRVVPEGDGVLVTLTNLSANRRAQIQRLRFGGPRAALGSATQ